ncbi:MAG: DUF4115 domain-containing protein [Synergistaceae bacterium]|nr:DUF4115 domain-containing protein [Synergistaceae bacterium]
MIEHNEKLVELGRIVAERRESVGMTLEAVFDKTRIRPEYLRGIEEGDYTDFPEPVYVRGFIRTYLKVIGAEDLLEDFNVHFSTHTEHSRASVKKESGHNMANILGNGSSMPEGFKPVSHFWLFLVLVAALVGTAAYVWYAMSNGGLDLKNLKLFNFGNNNGGLVSSENLSNDIAIIETEIEDVVISDEPVISEEPEPEIKPSLEIHAINDVWLSVAFGNAQPTFRRTLKRGDVMRWDLEEPARVVIGRPTSAQVILNGQDLGIVNPRAKKSETYLYNVDGTYRKIK